jgi:tripartite motif-containing protein 71
VYVTDTGNNRIQKFTNDGTYIRTWGGSGSGDGEFNFPSGIGVDSSANVYVSDTHVVSQENEQFSGNGNGRIQKFTNTGIFIRKWGSKGSADGQFIAPRGIAIKSAKFSFLEDRVFVADAGNNRIQVFKPKFVINP